MARLGKLPKAGSAPECRAALFMRCTSGGVMESFESSNWSLKFVVAWLCLRDRAAVEMCFSEEKWAEVKMARRRKRLLKIARTDIPSTVRTDLMAAYDGNQFTDVASAEVAVLIELSKGRLSCTAL